MALADRAELAVRLTLDDKAFSGPLRRAQGSLGRFGQSAGRVGKGVGQIGTGLARAGLLVGGAAITGIGLAAKAAIDYEDAFAGVRKTVDGSEAQLQTLSDQFRDLARTIPISATEFARLGEIAGALGIEVGSIDEFAEVTAKLGVTTNLTADAAADALGRIGNILNLTADDYDNFGSALVLLGNKGASTESEIIEITKRFAAAGKMAGLTVTEILGLAEATASFTGLNEEAAGSSLSRLTGILTKVAAGGGEKFALLNQIVGEDFRKALDKDAGDALLGFLKGLDKLDKYERASALKALGLDSVYLRQLLGGLTDNIDDVKKSLDNADEGWRGNFLNEEAAKKFDTIAQKIKLLRNNFLDAGITIGTEFLPALGRTTDKLIAFLKVPGNQTVLKEIGRDIGNTIDKIDWGKVLDGARSFVGVMKGALDVALSIISTLDKLPGELKAAGVGFLALDKLSGGLFGAGVGNVLGGLTEALTRSLGSQLPGVGKLFTQPVFITGAAPGVFGGLGGPGAPGGGGALGLLTKVFVVGFAAEAASQLSPVVSQAGVDLRNTLFPGLPVISASDIEWPFGPKNTPTILPELFGPNGFLGGTPKQAAPGAPVTEVRDNSHLDAQRAAAAALERVRAGTEANRIATVTGLNSTRAAINTARIQTNAVNRSGDASIVAAIRGIQRPIISVSVTGNVIRTTYRTGATLTRSIRPGILALT